jgi:hypothetical protein
VIPREAKTLTETLQASVPGLRKDLPVNLNSIRHMDISKVAELVEKAPAGTFVGTAKADVYHLMKHKIIEGIKSGDLERGSDEVAEYRRIAMSLLPLEERRTISKERRTRMFRREHP